MPLSRRTESLWHLRTRTLALGPRTVVMGILNVTPDSFSDGGHFYTPQHAPERALAQALKMLDEGAAILDIGGESTRPNATPLSEQEEQARVLPVIEAILKERPQTILSIDTFHAGTARHAIAAGAEIVNDVSGHLWDPEMANTCAQLGCGTVMMHTRGTPQQWRDLPPLAPDEVLPMVIAELRERLQAAAAAGIAPARIVIDPGLGFGKRLDENYPLLARLDQLQQLGRPMMVGASRKGFLARSLALLPHVPDTPPPDRLHASNAANVGAILAGAHIIRTHDVRPALEAATIADRILAAV